jgi:hypothetical protein
MKKGLVLALVVLMASVAVLGAQEGPPPPPDGLTFSGSVITGLRWKSFVAGAPGTEGKKNVFDIEAGDDYLTEGDTAALRGALNKGTYGANFGLSLNANNSFAGMWTTGAVYVSEASLWAKVLDNKIGVKAGYFGDFDYFSPVHAWSLAGGSASNATQLTVYPIEGLQIDVRTKNLQNSNPNSAPFSNAWYEGEQFIANIDAGVRYANPSFTVWVALDDDYSATPGSAPRYSTYGNEYQTDVFGYFAFTGVPKLTVGVETKFIDLTSQRRVPGPAPDPAVPPNPPNPQTYTDEAVGITNRTAINASYQITDALSARIYLVAGSDHFGFGSTVNELLGENGFTAAADVEVAYKLNNSLRFILRPVFQIPSLDETSVLNVSVKPKVEWTLFPGPYAATINFWYMLRYYGGETKNSLYVTNDNYALSHSIAATFGWTF